MSMENEELGTADIDPSHIIIQSEIATGSFGKVFKGELHGSPCAIKQMFQIAGKFDIDAFKREVQIMSKLSHPNVVLLMGASVRPENIFIITEFIEGTDLNEVLQRDEELSLFRIYNLGLGIATGMNWLHNLTPPIVHRDLKPANVLIAIRENYWQAKICDFGLSTFRDNAKLTTKNLVGSVAWMAPEALLRQPFDEKVDIYAYSLILWQIFTCERYPMDTAPFRSIQDLTRAVCDDYLRPDIPEIVPPKVAKLLRQGWSDDPQERPDFGRIIQQLKKGMVPVIINNENAGKFWNANWTETTIPFNRFYTKLYSYFERTHVPTSEEEDGADWTFHQCLDTVLKEQGSEVSLESLGRVLMCYGDFDESLFRKIYEILCQPWYHGDIERQDAEHDLKNFRKKDSFLVRASTAYNTPFTISTLKSAKKSEVIHQRIFRTVHGFSYTVRIGKQKETLEAPTLVDLVTVILARKKYKILPRKKYDHLFSTQENEEGAYVYEY